MRHLEEGTIHAWIDGALPSSEAEYAERHVAGCPECAAAVADARGLIAGASRIVSSLDVVRGNVIPAQPLAAPGSRSLWRALHLTPARAAIAATLLLAVGSTFVMSSRDRRIMADTAVMATAAAPVVAASSAERAVAQPAAPVLSAPAPAVRVPAKRAEHEEPKVSVPPVAVATAEPAAPKPDSARVAELRALTEKAAERVADRAVAASAAGAASGVANTMQAAPRFAQVASPSVEGCYRLFGDSAAWPRAIPQRFSLERDTTAGANIVRSIDANGRLDSLFVGGRWRQMPANMAFVVFVPDPKRSVTVRFTLSSRRASVSADGQTRDVGVERTSCRP